jgi:putative ABC transport system permease protein
MKIVNLRISVRNVFRNRRRTLLSLLIMTAGASGLIVLGGFFDNLVVGYRESLIRSQSGHLEVNRRGYFRNGQTSPLDYLLPDATKLASQIEAHPEVTVVVPRLQFSAIANSAKTSQDVLVIGVDSERERTMGRSLVIDNTGHPPINVVAGDDLDAGEPYGATLGEGLMESLGLKVGERIGLLTAQKAGALNASDYRIRGAYQTILKEFDDHSMKVGLKTAQELLGAPDQVHSLLVVLKDTSMTDAMRRTLEAEFKARGQDMEIMGWEEVNPTYRESANLLNRVFQVVNLIICVVFFFNIANSINMSILERIREFGTMMAIGNSRWVIFGTIALEGSVLGLLGAAFGVLFGIGVARVISSIGIMMPPPPLGGTSYQVLVNVTAPLVLRSFLITWISATLASLPSAYRACHLQIVHALGYV